MSIYPDLDRPARALRPPPPITAGQIKRVAPKGGTAHRDGWTPQVRLLRVLIAATYAVTPRGLRGDADSVGSEIIEHIGELDQKAIHVLRVIFPMLWKLSGNRSRRR
jgi:hypothetical protein